MFAEDTIAKPDSGGLPGRALLGWMSADEAVRFLTTDCLFPDTISENTALETWQGSKRIVEALPRREGDVLTPVPMTDADLKTIRKFRSRYPGEQMVVDFVKLNPATLVVHQHWISPALAEKYKRTATPDKWAQMALLDPPSHAPTAVHRAGNTILFDLPHEEFILSGRPESQATLEISEPRGFVTVALHANRALLVGGYHRAFALARYCREAANAPRGVLFGVSSALEMLANEADDIRALMELERPPVLGDFFEPDLCMPVQLRRRRFQMRVSYEIVEASGVVEAELPAPQQNGSHKANEERRPSLPDVPVRRSDPVSRREAERLFNDALQLYHAERFDDAIAVWEHGLQLAPENSEAHAHVAKALLQQSRAEMAATHARQALYLDPGSADAHTSLGVALQQLGKTEAGALHFRQALSIDPGHSGALCNLGQACSVEGDIPGAVDLLRRAIRQHPGEALAYYNLASVHQFRREDEELSTLERLTRRSGLADRDAIYIHFALGKALEDIGDYRRAFAEYQAGNRIKRSKIDYAEPAVRAEFQCAAATFDTALMEKLRDAGNSSQAPVFVIGMPRSGSSLVEQVLASHPEIHGAGELDTIANIARATLIRTGRQGTFAEFASLLTAEVLRDFGCAYLASLPASGRSRCVNKMPGNFLYAGLIRLIFPNARIIHTSRNPVDTCVSCYTTRFEQGHPYSYELGELGRYYNWYAELMTHWHSVMPADSMLEVSYEELIADLEGQARRMIEYCGLSWDDRCLEFHRTKRPVYTASLAQVRRPIYSTSVGRWTRFEDSLEPLMAVLKPTAARTSSGH
jgi:tetratricopeptide (TPR) repeat protein